MTTKKFKMSEIEESASRLQTRLSQLTKIELVREASSIIEEI